MSDAAVVPDVASVAAVAPRRAAARWSALVLLLSIALTVAWTLWHGKDVHWDAVNYHLYLGYSAVHDRFAQDFFAAGPPSYLAPYAYVPLYAMTAAGWSAVAMAVAIAVWHALALWLTYEIAMIAGVERAGAHLRAWALVALAFAAINPVLLQGLGSTMTDISTGVPVLAAWLAIAHALRAGSRRALLVAGALGGAAAALKLSNAVFAIAAVPALCFLPGSIAARMRGLAAYGLACGAAFAACTAPWALQLWREFGNPFFPFFNQIFQSPDFTSQPLRYERFIPSGVGAWLARPFAMLDPASHVHTEPRAPDLRYATLIVVAAAWTIARRYGGASPTDVGGARPNSVRPLLGLSTGLVVAWLLWLGLSGNSRYFIPMACVAGVVLALLLQRLHARWPDATLLVAVVLVGVQCIQLAVGSDLRRDGYAWGGPWMRVEIPERLRAEPSLHLSVAFLSGSALLPYMHPQAGMINVGGFNVIAPGHPGYGRAQALIGRNEDRLRLLLPLPRGIVDRATLPGPPEQLDVYVRRLGLRVDGSDCVFPRLEGSLRGERRPEADATWKYFISCRLVKAPEGRMAYEQRVREVDVAFDRVEDACPSLFHPRRPPTQEYGYLARTYHMGAEMQLFVDDGRVKYYYPLRGGDPIDIGPLAAWKDAPQPFDCARRTQPAFQRRKP